MVSLSPKAPLFSLSFSSERLTFPPYLYLISWAPGRAYTTVGVSRNALEAISSWRIGTFIETRIRNVPDGGNQMNTIQLN